MTARKKPAPLDARTLRYVARLIKRLSQRRPGGASCTADHDAHTRHEHGAHLADAIDARATRIEKASRKP